MSPADKIAERIEKLDRPLTIVFLGSRFVGGEHLVPALRSEDSGICFQAYQSALDWLKCGHVAASLFVIAQEQCFSAKALRLSPDLRTLRRQSEDLPFAILSDCEDPLSAMEALRLGARGYIPANLPLPVVLQILKLIVAGGLFVPFSSLLYLVAEGAGTTGNAASSDDVFEQIDLAAVQMWCKVNSDDQAKKGYTGDASIRGHLTKLLKRIDNKRVR